MVGPRSKIPTWSQDSSWPLFHLFCACMLLLSVTSSAAGSLGCADGSREGLLGFDRIAACAGEWKGHVHNATTLCSPGWHVCSWYDHALLRNITWKIAMSVPGCYAFNAAQDGGRCQECREDLEHDDVAGIGQGCAHKNRGQSSCISGGRIDASCCVDSHFDRACAFQPRLMTGALCCRMPVKPPLIVVKPPERMHVYTGLIFLLTCQATGMPPPRIQWYKNGQQTTDNSRTSILSSGDLLVTLARKSDTGLYTCEVINEEGIDMASSFVTVTEYTSGCADGSTEGLHLHRTVHACAGRWEGHVQLGKTLCRRGWRVCNPKDKEALQQLTWLDFFDLSGCYAYNAANRHGHCRKCKDGRMAGIGRDCKWMRHSQSSCLSRGSVEVQNPHNSSGCHYKEGVTSGVVCCKRIKNDENKQSRKTTCTPPCENGGTCVDHNRCHCAPGYKGARCQNAICEPGCGMKGNCVKPNTCQCQSGYTGLQCSQKIPKCGQPCVNGGRCLNGKCRCLLGYQGRFCQYMSQHIGLAMLNRTEK